MKHEIAAGFTPPRPRLRCGRPSPRGEGVVAALIALLFCGVASAQEIPVPSTPAPPNPIQALEDCVLGQAQRLEISREAADAVAEAAVAKCGRALTNASLDNNGRPNRDARQQLKDSMRESALVAVVEMRADRNTPKPPPPPPAKSAPRKKR